MQGYVVMGRWSNGLLRTTLLFMRRYGNLSVWFQGHLLQITARDRGGT